MSSISGEVLVRVGAGAAFAGALGTFAVGNGIASETVSNATTDAARQACYGDSTVQEAVRTALEGQVGGGPLGGDVCSVIDGSGDLMTNLAQNTAEKAVTDNGGPYAALFQGIENAFMQTEWRILVTAGALAVLGGVAAWVGGHLTARRTGRRHL